ncbi:MAG: serine/threonine protein kinase [Acidobacteria bacterium]|nr:serine/threonine protein kinase [Acidobacteriota bacterium]
MGEVYRAEDLKLSQTVAIKFLPQSLSQDGGALQRFHSEVRIARQVAHPNVCRMFDIGEVDGVTFLTMEFVDGEDLASLIRRIGRLPQDKAIEVARQICAGLAAAHHKGVVQKTRFQREIIGKLNVRSGFSDDDGWSCVVPRLLHDVTGQVFNFNERTRRGYPRFFHK